MVRFEINKSVAPKDWDKFKAWFKKNLPNFPASVEDAYKSLGHKIPEKMKDDNIGSKKKIK